MAKTLSYTAVAALQSLAANSVFVTDDIAVAAKYGGILVIQFARAVTTALTASVRFEIESAGAAAGDMAWALLVRYDTAIATAVRLAVTTESAAGQKEIAMSNTTGFALRDRIFIENATLGNSEFRDVALIHASTHLTTRSNLANIQQVTAFVSNLAERYRCKIDPENARIRLTVDNSPNAVAVYWKADLVTWDTLT